MTAAPDGDPSERFAATLETTQFMPRAELVGYRDALLARLSEFAYRQSPFYRERLKPLFRHGDRPDFRAWKDIPLLRRADLETHMERINPPDLPADIGAVVTRRTSGTSSARLSFRTCALARIAAECMMNRLYRWHCLDLEKSMASVRFYGLGRRNFPEGVTQDRWSYPGPRADHYTLDIRTPSEQIVEWLLRRRPDYLLTFPSFMTELAASADAAALALKGVVAISEIVTDHCRARTRETFNCEIAQVYASAEVGCIALQAPSDTHCLACEESVMLEILDENGNDVSPGQTGRVVVTSLYNYATPFIRYEIGDYATLACEPCPSGRQLMRLRRIDGRTRNGLRAANGRRVWANEILTQGLFRDAASQRIQITQPDPARIEMAYIPDNPDFPPDAAALGARFRKLLGRPVDVSLTAMASLTRSGGGKREPVVSLCGD
jgi:phenylacetate-CoA ligase